MFYIREDFVKLKAILFLIMIVLLFPCTAQAYIGPGAGIAVVGSFWAIFAAFFSALSALFIWPIRYVIRTIKGRHAFARSKIEKCVIVGLDGMDFKLTEKMLDEDKLPNFARLKNKGCFKPLATSIPSISPVAWSSFQTGSNPGKHNIFDFLTRDNKTYMPRLSSVDIRPQRQSIRLGKYQLGLGKADIRLLRKGKPFWKTLGENGIFSSILRVPITFPPERFYGVSLSGMCVPDLKGTQGMFSVYTTRLDDRGEHIGGERYKVEKNKDIIKAELIGPANPLRSDNKVLKLPFEVKVIDKTSVRLRINGNGLSLGKGEYTDWVKVEFRAAPCFRISGICKFLLISVEPEFELYVTPINIDPEKPAMPISHPSFYSTYLSKKQGAFATLGLAEDSWALNEEVLTDDAFIEQCVRTDQEREEMFFDSLDKVKKGLCVCVFDGTDRIQHTFWRDIDQEHPARQLHLPAQERNTIEEHYQRTDSMIGRIVEKCDNRNTLLMIISDHGFSTFRYGVDLNRWLEENGYLVVGQGQRDKKHLQGIEWSETRAFAIGLSGIYLNLKGRESKGIVDPGTEATQLRDEISEKLSKLIDENRNVPAVKNVYNALKIYNGPYQSQSPDLLIGFNKGYRASWETAVGQVTEQVFHDNKKAWSGDHCIDPSLVPGVLFCNRKIESGNPRLMDIGPTTLDMFGVSVPEYMDGKVLAVAGDVLKKNRH